MKDKNFTYINEYYGRNLKCGDIVRIAGSCSEAFGSLEYGNSHVFVKVLGKVQGGYHPNDIQLIKEWEKELMEKKQ